MENSKYWADQIARKVVEEFPDEKIYTVAAGITPSGTVHFGNFREIITTDIIYRALKDLGKKARFIYSWDDYDRIRKIPKNVPKEFEKYMFMPGVDAPDPWKCHKSYVEHFEKEIEETVPLVGIKPEFIRQAQMYRACKYAEEIKFVLENRFEIREILNKYREEPLPANWYPVAVYCEKCKKERTQILDWDSEYTLKYKCECGFEGETNFSKEGLTKLPWRVDWPMRWKYENVNCEGGGKEHNAPGGSLDTAHDLCANVFEQHPPVRFMYDFLIVRGAGGKMASSTGNVIKLPDVLAIFLPEITRFIYAGRKPITEFSISFDEEVFKTYEDFYECERIYFGKDKANEREKAHWSRVYEMSCIDKPPKKMPVQPAFKHCAELINIYQEPRAALDAVCEKEKLTKQDRERYIAILERARNWTNSYAPEQYRIILQETPKAKLNAKEKGIIRDFAKELKTKKDLIDIFRQVAEQNDVKIRDFFIPVYKVLVGREIGPRLAPFIEAVGREKIRKILEKI